MNRKFSLRLKTALSILIITIALGNAAVTVSYNIYAYSMDTHLKAMSSSVARTAATILDPGEVRRYTDAVKAVYLQNPAPEFASNAEEEAYLAQYDSLRDEGYWRLYDTLVDIRTSSGVLFIYIIYVDADSKTCVYIVDGDTTESNCPAGTWDIIYEQNYGVFDNPEQGFPSYITDTEEFGWLASTGAPILDESGDVIAYLMVDMSMDSMMDERSNYLMWLVLAVSGVAIVAVLLFVWRLHRTVVRPINQLATAVSSYVQDRQNAATGKSKLELLEIHTGDEIENLSDAVKQMEQDIHGYIQTINDVTAEAETDGLTGLWNRKTFSRMVEDYINGGGDRTGAFMMVDLDYFKSVNDNYGHAAGDLLLQNCAGAMWEVFRSTDIIGRQGGDEFVVFCPGIHGGNLARQRAAQLADTWKGITPEGSQTPTTASIGIAMFPEHGLTFEELYQNADTALYEAKESGRNCNVLFHSGSEPK